MLARLMLVRILDLVFREFISNKNKDEFSSLNTASKEGHAEIVQMLLDDASKAYGGKNTDGFREFISSPK